MRLERFALADEAATMSVAEDFGINICSWTVAGQELFHTDPSFGAGADTFHEGGNPLLFPAVGRTWDQTATPPVPERYSLAATDRTFHMPIHGIVPLGSWTRINREETADAVHVAYAFHYGEAVRERHYPFRIQLRQDYTLRARTLHLAAHLTNVGSEPAPAALGYHPYFRLGNGRVRLELPCREQLEEDPELLVPTGNVLPFAGTLALGPTAATDTVYAGMTGAQARLCQDAGPCVTITTDGAIENYVVYKPADALFVCVEPWTRGLGGFGKLQRPDWPDGRDIPVLAPGASLSATVTFARPVP